jgi:predicted amidophosphoribosyltransferase
MPRYLCPSCHEVTEPSGAARYAWCTACGQPLSLFDLLPVRPGVPPRSEEPAATAASTAPVAEAS